MSESTCRIAEIFGPTIQGEGALIGEPTVFVRSGGCDYRCSWCDSFHAVDSEYRDTWKPMLADEILNQVEALSGNKPLMVTLSGGNPAIQPFGNLIKLGQDKGYRFAMETQGSIAQDWFASLDTLVLSPKPPSSGEVIDWDKFDECLIKAQSVNTAMKIVIFDEEDYLWAKEVAENYEQLPCYLQPGNHTPPNADDETIDMDGIYNRYEWLIERSLKDQWYNVKILPQLHVLVWGNKRGV